MIERLQPLRWHHTLNTGLDVCEIIIRIIWLNVLVFYVVTCLRASTGIPGSANIKNGNYVKGDFIWGGLPPPVY